MEIRLITEEDLKDLAELEEICFSDPWPEIFFESYLGNDAMTMAVVTDEDKIVAYACMTTVLDEGNIDNIAVHPEYRGFGIGNLLLSFFEDVAKELGLQTMTLEVRESNEPAKALYQKHHFEIVGRRPRYYENPTEDALLMTMWLQKED